MINKNGRGMDDMEIVPVRSKWKSRMTDRERFNNQMHYRGTDRSFNMEFGYWNENFSTWQMFIDNGIKTNEDADIFFGFDRIEAVGGNIWLDPCFPQTIVSETAKNYIMMNRDGLLAEVPKDCHDTIPHYIRSSVVTPDDWEKVKRERFRRDDKSRAVDTEALKARHDKERDYPLGVYCGSMIGKIRDLLTFEGLAYAVYDYPDMVEDMVETCCLLVEDFLDQVLPHIDFDYASGWEDIAFKNGPIVSVDFFRDIVMPRYKRISRKLHTAGIDIWYTDCDGDVRPILPYMLEGGINCLFPFEVNGCSHPGELLSIYGSRLRIMGGVDKLKMKAGRQAISGYMDSLIPLVRRGGYIPFCDHRCPPDVTQENYLYYLDLKEQLFGIE